MHIMNSFIHASAHAASRIRRRGHAKQLHTPSELSHDHNILPMDWRGWDGFPEHEELFFLAWTGAIQKRETQLKYFHALSAGLSAFRSLKA